MKGKIVSALRWGAFLVLLTLALIGLLLPVMPQIPFFIAAFVVIAPESRWIRRKYVALRERHPRLFHPIESWRAARRKRRQEARPPLPGPAPAPVHAAPERDPERAPP